jgi:hypothetical protein
MKDVLDASGLPTIDGEIAVWLLEEKAEQNQLLY